MSFNSGMCTLNASIAIISMMQLTHTVSHSSQLSSSIGATWRIAVLNTIEKRSRYNKVLNNSTCMNNMMMMMILVLMMLVMMLRLLMI